MAVPDPYTVYQIARACYVGGKLIHKLADQRVAAWASEQGMSKQEAWALVRAEAKRRGDESLEAASDQIINMGWKAHLIPGGNALVLAAHGWKLAKKQLGG